MIILLILTAALLVRFVMLGKASQEGAAFGLVNGLLAPCPEKPNCVNSEFSDDEMHAVSSLPLTNQQQDLMKLKKIVSSGKGVILVDNNGYLSATYASPVFGFVDDVEFRVDADSKTIHLRSASRVGHSDLGVNRERAEKIIAAFMQE